MNKLLSTSIVKHLYALIAFATFTVLSGTPLLAKEQSNPYELIEQVADSTFSRIVAEQATINQNPNHLKTIVSEQLMPHVDHRYASRVILHKSTATKTQRKAFYRAFKAYLTTTYATVFAGYNPKQRVVFEPAKPVGERKKLLVKTKIVVPSQADTHIDFKVRLNKKTGHWKAYDIRAMGVSLLDSKKAELVGLLRQPGGVDKVIALLNEKATADIVSTSVAQH